MSSINQTFINYNAPEIIPEINVFTLNVGTQNVNTLNVTGTLTAPNFDLGASDVTVQNLDVNGNVSLTLNKNLIVLTNGGSYTPQLATQIGYCGNVQDGDNSSQTFPNTNYGIDASPLFQTISDALVITVPGTYLLTAQANLVPVNSSDVASYGIAICTTSSTSNANTFCKEVFPNYNDTDNNPTLWGSLQGPSLLCSGLNTFTTVPQSLYIGISCNPNTAVGLQAVGYTLKLQAMKIV